jgi:hypothetical protein
MTLPALAHCVVGWPALKHSAFHDYGAPFFRVPRNS